MKFIPSLADKAALTLFYNNNNDVDFSPYNRFANIIQEFYKLYITRVRACIYIQRTYRGFSWRKIIFNFRGTNIQYITTIVEKLRPEWPVRAWSSFIERRGGWAGDGGGVVPWREWVKFYDNWVTAFSHHLRPIFCRRRMNFHASLYNTRVLYRFAD